MKNVLYISYDGMTDSLGRSQVLPYLCGLSEQGYAVTLISAEKPEAYETGKSAVERIVADSKIDWPPVGYPKRPPIVSTLKDIFKIKRTAVELYRDKKFDLVHCRSYISAFVGLAMKRRFGCRFVFDMRGFYADERVDGKIWNTQRLVYRMVYNFFKRKEKTFMSESDAIVSLTYSAKSEILSWKLQNVAKEKITVIPCCADTNHFDYERQNIQDVEKWRNVLNINTDNYVLSYLGSVGTWYMLPEMMDFFSELLKLRSNAVFLLITRDSRQLIMDEALRHNIPENKIIVQPATRDEVPQLALLSDASLFFIKPVWSKKASSPTKLAELMSLGIPCLTNRGVGDVDAIMEENPIGILIDGWTASDYDTAISKLLTLPAEGREIARQQACDKFSLETGVLAYKQIYERLTL